MKKELPNWFKKREKKEYNEIQLWMIAISFFIIGFCWGIVLFL